MNNSIDSFPTTVQIPVAWSNMDAFAHVNNGVYFRFFEDVRIEYFRKIGFGGTSLSASVGPILKSTMCNFRFPLTYPDTVIAGTKCIALEPDRFTMKYAIYSLKHQKIVADGEGTIVAFDYGSQKKARLSPETIDAIQKLDNISLASV